MGVETFPGDLVEIQGWRASGKLVVAVADSGIYIDDKIAGMHRFRFIRDKDRCYTTLGKAL